MDISNCQVRLSRCRSQSLANAVRPSTDPKIRFSRFPLSPMDPIVRQIQDKRARVVIIDINLENFQSALYAVEVIRRIAGHLAVVVRGDLTTPLNLMAAMRLSADEYLSRENRYDILDTFWCLSRARSKTSAPDREAPPTAPVYAPLGRGPRPMRPREVALAL